MKLIAKKAFSWAHRGVEIEQFEDGQVIETEDVDLVAVATAEGWAKEASAKVKTGAPENKEA